MIDSFTTYPIAYDDFPDNQQENDHFQEKMRIRVETQENGEKYSRINTLAKGSVRESQGAAEKNSFQD